MTRYSMRTLRTAAVVAVLAAASCTLLGDRDLTQCTTDADCKGSLAGQNAAAACVDQLCVRVSAIDAGQDVVDAGGDAPPLLDCTTSKDCPTDKDFICAGGKCEAVVSTTCPRLVTGGNAAAYREPGGLIIGLYTVDPSDFGPEVRAAEVAIADFERSGLVNPRVAALLCAKAPTAASGSAGKAIAEATRLKLPVMLGQFEASELAKLERLDVSVWPTLGTLHPLDGRVPTPDGGMPFRFMLDELQSLAPGFEAGLEEAIHRAEALRSLPLGSLGTAARIKLVVNDQIEAPLLATRLEQGNSLIDGGSQYERIPPAFPLKAQFENGEQNVSIIVNELAKADATDSTRAHVIVAIGGDEVSQLIIGVENKWATGPRPIWVVTTRAKAFINATAATPGLPTSLRARVIGVDFAGDVGQADTFSKNAGEVRGAAAFAHVYDSFYAVVFAAMRANFLRGTSTQPLMAADLVRGLDEVMQPAGAGMTVVGPAGFTRAVIDAVSVGGKVHFIGASSGWSFSTSDVGYRRMGTSFFCFPTSGSSVVQYRAASSLTTECAPP